MSIGIMLHFTSQRQWTKTFKNIKQLSSAFADMLH